MATQTGGSGEVVFVNSVALARLAQRLWAADRRQHFINRRIVWPASHVGIYAVQKLREDRSTGSGKARCNAHTPSQPWE